MASIALPLFILLFQSCREEARSNRQQRVAVIALHHEAAELETLLSLLHKAAGERTERALEVARISWRTLGYDVTQITTRGFDFAAELKRETISEVNDARSFLKVSLSYAEMLLSPSTEGDLKQSMWDSLYHIADKGLSRARALNERINHVKAVKPDTTFSVLKSRAHQVSTTLMRFLHLNAS